MEIITTVALILSSLLLSLFLLGAAAKGWRKLRKKG
jgi:hypothetical protein